MRALAEKPIVLAAAMLLAVLASAAVFWEPLVELERRWASEPEYSHGYLVPLFALAILWLRRDQLRGKNLRGSWWGLALVGLCLALQAFGEYYYYSLLRPISLLPFLVGMLLLLAGWGAVAWAWPAIGFLAFMIPLPDFLKQSISLPLQRTAAVLSTWLLQIVGQPAIAEGNTIAIRGFRLEVAEACSGLRLLTAITALVVGYAIVVERSRLHKALLLACVLPIAVLANALRLAFTGLAYQNASAESARAVAHDGAGWLMIPLAAALVGFCSWLIGKLLRPPALETEEDNDSSGPIARLFDVRLLRITGCVLASLFVGAAIVRYVQFQRSGSALLREANALEEAQRHSAAAERLGWYLRMRPQEAEAWVRLAWLHDSLASGTTGEARAAESFRRAIAAQPGDLKLRRRHMELLLKLGRSIEAEREAALLLAIDPADDAASRMRGLALFHQFVAGRPVTQLEVENALRAALRGHDADTVLWSRLAVLPRVRGAALRSVPELIAALRITADSAADRRQEALGIARAMLSSRSPNAPDQLGLGELLLMAGNHREAEQAFRRAVELSPDDVRFRLRLISFYVQIGNQAKARQTLAALERELAVAADFAPWMLAQGYALVGNREAAEASYLDALRAMPRQVGLQPAEFEQQAADFLRGSPRAEAVLRQAREAAPDSRPIRYALAEVLAARQGDDAGWREALQLAGGDKDATDLRDRRFRARLLIERGGADNLEQAIESLERLLKESRADDDRWLLARALLAADRHAAAAAQLAKLAEAESPAAAHLIAYFDLLLTAPASATAPMLPEPADRVVFRASERHRDNPEVLVRVATLRYRQRRLVEAIALYERVLQLQPAHVLATNNLAMLLSEEPGQHARALEMIDAALRLSGGNDLRLRDTRAMILLRQGETAAALEALLEITAALHHGPDGRATAYHGRDARATGVYWLHLALAYQAAGNRIAASEARTKASNARAAAHWLTPREQSKLAALDYW